MDSVQGIGEERIKQLLTETHGDLYLCAQQLGITTLQMDRLVRFNPTISGLFLEIQRLKADPEYDRQSHAWFVDRLQRASVIYRFVGYEVLHELATMPVTTAAMTEVKRKAAASLKGEELILRNGADVDREMEELRLQYERDAPRLREARGRLLEHRTGAAPLLSGPVDEPANLGQADAHVPQQFDDLGARAGVGVDG